MDARRPVVRDARRDEGDAIAALLARAFARNPFVRWLVPDDDRYARVGSGLFRIGVEREMAHGIVHVTDDHAGAALWLAPDAPAPGPLAQLALAWTTMRLLGSRTPAGIRATLEMERRRAAQQPNWYLTVLGTIPERQGTGVGTTLLRPMLERCDREGIAAYLESSDPDNVPFYERFGFVVLDELRFPGGPRMPLMLRRPSRKAP
ncbi:MAG TPA: GNAT family N-acetyltransferase [Candidatus Limnocylindrales bacterium]|nr:GNAT family N-acetyltransferase [Candidatus Limnocylindrales bacterium]